MNQIASSNLFTGGPMRRRTGIAARVMAGLTALALTAATAACSGSGGSSGSGGPATPPPRIVSGLGGTVKLTVPHGAETPGTTVQIVPHTGHPLRFANAAVPHAVPVMPPVAVNVRGRLAPNRVRITLKLPDNRPAAVYRDAYVAVYEPMLAEFVPLVDSRTNPRAHTVTALAPHFSVYDAFVSVGKKVTGHVIDWADVAALPWLPLVPSLQQAIGNIQKEAVDALFGFGPELECSPPSSKVEVKVHDVTHGQLMEACAEDYTDNSGRIHIRVGNHYGFPILFNPPSGFTVGLRDFDFENGTLFDFIRHVIWMNWNMAEAPGADNANMTLQPGTHLPVTVNGNMDWGAVGVDVTYFLATIAVPELKEMSPELRTALEEVEATIPAGQSDGQTGAAAFLQAAAKASQQAQQVLGPAVAVINAGECAYNEVRAATGLFKGGLFNQIKDKMTKVEQVGLDCLKDPLASLGGSTLELLNGIASDLKVLPEMAYTKIAENLAELHVNATKASLTVQAIPWPDGTYYGFFSHIGQNPNEVSFDQVQYFQGDAAKKACIADGKLPPWHDVVCNEYYIRDLHKAVTLRATGNVTVLDWHGPDQSVRPEHRISLAAAAALVSGQGGQTFLWKLTVKHGLITQIEGIYRP